MTMMKAKWDNAGINSRTDRTLLRVEVHREWLDNVANDKKKEQRLALQECVVCFYTVRIVGQGFTTFICLACDAEGTWPNTSIPSLCKKCAKELQVCQHCGADLQLHQRQ